MKFQFDKKQQYQPDAIQAVGSVSDLNNLKNNQP